jgi:hypothetical protein
MRVGFLLNHYYLHQVPHVVPYAFELSRRFQDFDVTIFSSTADEQHYARDIGEAYPDHGVIFRRLDIPIWVKAVEPVFRNYFFIRKEFALRSNIKEFANLDVLVSPEMTCLSLRRHHSLQKLRLIFTGHGAGDNRKIGSFDSRIGKFDLALLPGRKYAEALLEIGYLNKDIYAISGYPKFEIMHKLGVKRNDYFNNGRPTVVYNPHHAPHMTSWHRFGREVLDFFLASKDYNLIFAPHVVLFERAWAQGARFPAEIKSTDNVLIDLGSRASTDMSYLYGADIYLGDNSSQVYEFIETPKPCVFLNAQGPGWQDDPSYKHWHFGPVIENINQLPDALSKARTSLPQYSEAQRTGFKVTFETSDGESAARGADIIAEFATTGKVSEVWR